MLGFRISDPIQNSDHLQTNLFLTIQNPILSGFQIPTLFVFKANWHMIDGYSPTLAKRGPFEIRSSTSPDFKCFWILNDQIFNPQWTVTIWIPDSSEYWTVWVSSFQMVKSRDLADYSNTGHFGPLAHFVQSILKTTIWIPDHLTTGHKSTIWIPN